MKKFINLIKQNILILIFLLLPLTIWAGVSIHYLLYESEYTHKGRIHIEEKRIEQERLAENQRIKKEKLLLKVKLRRTQYKNKKRITKEMQKLFNDWNSKELQSLSILEGISIDSLKIIFNDGMIYFMDYCDDYCDEYCNDDDRSMWDDDDRSMWD